MKKNSKVPIIKIHNVKENSDGSMSIDFEYDKNWVTQVKSDLKKKKVTKKDIEKHFVDLLTKATEETDGYKLKKKKIRKSFVNPE